MLHDYNIITMYRLPALFVRNACALFAATMPLLPSIDVIFLIISMYRLAGDARINNSSSGCGSEFLCTHLEGEHCRCLHMPYHCLLPAARTHPGIWWIQKLVYTTPWNIKHCWDYPSDSLSRVGTSASLPLGTLACRLER